MWSVGANDWVTPENFVPVGGGQFVWSGQVHGQVDSDFGDTYWNELTQSWTGFFGPAPSFSAGTVDGEDGTGELTGLVWSETLGGWVTPEHYTPAA